MISTDPRGQIRLDVPFVISPMISVSRKMSVEEVAALIDQTMEESITRRNSAIRRGMILPLLALFSTHQLVFSLS